MAATKRKRITLLYPGDRAARDTAKAQNNRFANVAAALSAVSIDAEPAVYHDDFAVEVRSQLLQVDGVLVWVNPFEGERDRTVLDAMLRDVASRGVYVSAYPDMILKIGTKEVLYATRGMDWGCDVHRYLSLEEMRRELPMRLAEGKGRVLKQYRGNGGNGVWKVERAAGETGGADMPLLVRHAKRGCIQQQMTLEAFLHECEPYFRGQGRMIDQPYQKRLAEGMIRCYLVHDQVGGFGHQAINALYPIAPGQSPAEALQPGPRYYFPPDRPEFGPVKRKMETQWLPALKELLNIKTEELPVLWDVDLMLGDKTPAGEDTYVLCEINVSSVSPFPPSAEPMIARALARRFGLIG